MTIFAKDNLLFNLFSRWNVTLLFEMYSDLCVYAIKFLRREIGVLHTALMMYWGMVGGMPLFKCVLKYNIHAKQMVASCTGLSNWMSFSRQSFCYSCLQLWRLRCPSRREISLGNFSFSSSPVSDTKELKVERGYRVKVFNGFINAWFDLILTSKWKL